MTNIIDWIHRALHAILALLLGPFERLEPLWGLTAISVVLGVILVLAYGKLSRQASIRKVKSDIYRAVLESVLFRHDLRLSLAAQKDMLVNALKYFFLAVPPLLILGIPCLLVLAQLNQWYGSRPLRIGEPGIVRAELADRSVLPTVSLDSSADISVTPPMRIPSSGEVFWRVTPLVSGHRNMTLKVGAQEYKIPMVSGAYHGPLIIGSYLTWWHRIFSPDNTITTMQNPSAGLIALEIHYPSRDYLVAGMRLSWLVVFFCVSLISGLIGSKVFGVEV